MKGSLNVMNARDGHAVIEWDTEQKDGPLDPAYANAEFERLIAGGWLAFGTTATKENHQLRRGSFDPEAYEKVTMFRQIAGG